MDRRLAPWSRTLTLLLLCAFLMLAAAVFSPRAHAASGPLTLSFAPATVFGGGLAVATVTLSQPAPDLPDPNVSGPNGAYVRISKDDGGNAVYFTGADVPVHYVYIPAGQTVGTFSVQASSVSSPVLVYFTAQVFGGGTSAVLAVKPFDLASLTLNRPTVGAGGHLTATLTLTGPAPALPGSNYPGYVYIRLTSSQASTVFTNTNYQGNGALLIPVGATSVTFDVTPGAVSVDTPITITATYNSSLTASFTALTIPADTTIPVTTLSLSGTTGNGGWYVAPVSVTLFATDAAGPQDLAATYYTLDGVQHLYSGTFLVTVDGAHALTYWSVDRSGNTEIAHTQPLNVDQTAPFFTFGPLDPAPNAAGWNNSVVHLSYTAMDATSGVLFTWPGTTLDFIGEGAGLQWGVYAIDAAGNPGFGPSTAVNIDWTAPITTVSVSETQVTFVSTDALSGIANTYYTIDGGAQQTYTTPFTVTGSGIHSVSYWSVDIAGNVEAAQSYSLTVNPAPVAGSLAPSSIAGGGPDFTLTVNGSNFVGSSQVLWNGAALATAYVSATQLTATVPAANIAADGSAQISVMTPAPGGGVSNSLTFTIQAPQRIDSISPGVIYTGSADTTVYVSGAGYVAGSVVTWNGSALATTFVSTTNLTAVIPASYLALPGSATIAVTNPGFGPSNTLPMQVVASQPHIDYTSPNSAIAGGAAFMLYVNGSQFQPGCTISWNGIALVTTYQSGVVLTASIPESYIATAGTASIVVTSPIGVSSNTFAFPINNNLPILYTITPSTVNAGSGDITLVASGGQMTPVSQICWNGTPLPTTYIDVFKVSATIPASKLTTPGAATITVTAPAPGGGTSAALTFTIAAGHPPVTTASLSGTLGANGWYTSGVQMTLSATDPDGPSDVAATYYSIDGGAQQTYAAPFAIAAPGTHAVAYWSVDKLGNTEARHTQTVKIDSAAPVTTSAVSAAQVTLSATDVGSGVAATYYTIDGGVRQTYAAPFTVTGVGGHTITYWSVDAAGNTETSHSLSVTTNAVPVLTAISPAAATAGASALTLTATGTGFISGSTVKWNGTALTTTYISATSLTAAVPASLLVTAGTASVTVASPAPGGGTSIAKTFTITAPAGNATVSALVTSGSGPYYGEEQVNVSSTKTITALSVTITVQKTTGVRYQGQYGNFPGGAMTLSKVEDSSKIVYTYALKSGKTLNASSSWLSAAQFGGNGTVHPYTGDTYSVSVTSNGATQTFNGHF
ncbi:MAG: IPT/TIG domain-containing protein [Capsulimonas sp.]|uniref:beta strand repeat-containing protein n=1 Tax=Capsulimonas sp. TaxID=2494211 RepID=UPI003266A830